MHSIIQPEMCNLQLCPEVLCDLNVHEECQSSLLSHCWIKFIYKLRLWLSSLAQGDWLQKRKYSVKDDKNYFVYAMHGNNQPWILNLSSVLSHVRRRQENKRLVRKGEMKVRKGNRKTMKIHIIVQETFQKQHKLVCWSQVTEAAHIVVLR